MNRIWSVLPSVMLALAVAASIYCGHRINNNGRSLVGSSSEAEVDALLRVQTIPCTPSMPPIYQCQPTHSQHIHRHEQPLLQLRRGRRPHRRPHNDQHHPRRRRRRLLIRQCISEHEHAWRW